MTVLLFLVNISSARTLSLDDLYPVSSPIPKDLSDTGTMCGVLAPGQRFSLIPFTSLSAGVPDTAESVGTEALFLLPLPPGNDPLLFLLRKLTAVSTLKGIEYYSASRGQYRTLFTRASVLKEGGREETADPSFVSLPGAFELSAFLEDTTFGEAVYSLSFLTAGDCILATLTNRTPLYLGPMKALERDGMVFTLLAVPLEDSLLLYASGTAGLKKRNLFAGYVERSLQNRIFALKDWLAASLDSPY